MRIARDGAVSLPQSFCEIALLKKHRAHGQEVSHQRFWRLLTHPAPHLIPELGRDLVGVVRDKALQKAAAVGAGYGENTAIVEDDEMSLRHAANPLSGSQPTLSS